MVTKKKEPDRTVAVVVVAPMPPVVVAPMGLLELVSGARSVMSNGSVSVR